MRTSTNKIVNSIFRPAGVATVMLALLLLQLAGAWIFYLERMSFLDAPFMLLEILHTGAPAVQVGRYGSLLTQVWPWLGSLMGLSLDTLLRVYSISFPAISFFVALALFRLRQYPWVIYLGAYFLLFYTDAFFWANNEIHQAVPIFCLAGGLFTYFDHNGKFAIATSVILFLMVGLAIFTHPLMLLVAVYFAGVLCLSPEGNKNKKSAILAAASVVFWVGLKYLSSRINWYDASKFTMLSDLSAADWLAFYTRPFWTLFWREMATYYYPALLLVAALPVGLILLRSGRKVFLWSLAFLVLTVILHTGLLYSFDRFYVESQLMIVSFFLIVPWYQHAEAGFFQRVIPGALLYLAVIWWGFSVASSASHFSERLAWHEDQIELVRHSGQPKVILPPLDSATTTLLIMPWGLPAESLILSSRDQGGSVTYIAPEFYRHDASTGHFHNCFDTLSIRRLPDAYFDLDTTSGYVPIR